MHALWQSLPLLLDPVALHIGPLPITWYAAMYVAGVFFSSLYFISLARRRGILADAGIATEMIVSVLWGVLVGARLGYVFFYGGSEFIVEPWRIISPYDFELGEWIGIRGMSFHGGLIGGAFGLLVFVRESKYSFFQFSDILVQAIPIALLFGRIGNFLNQEILGRATETRWGMYFPASGPGLFHPATLYEAFFEGLMLFVAMLILGRFIRTPGRLTAFFLFLYAAVRYVAESYRALPHPEDLVLGMWSIGQALSLAMVFLGVAILLWPRKRVV